LAKKLIEKLLCLLEDTDFINSFREENKAFIAKKGSNKAGRFLEVADYAMGGCCELFVVPVGQEWRG
jgi:hypothetical protein